MPSEPECGFLDVLDGLLALGAAPLSREFKDLHAGFIKSRRYHDKGFRGRGTCSDLYYTEFAVRSLVMLNNLSDLAQTAEYLRHKHQWPDGVAHAFSLLNLIRLLDKGGVRLIPEIRSQLVMTAERMTRATDRSVNHLFLSAMCGELLGHKMAREPSLIHAIRKLQQPDGGFSQLDGKHPGQTNATASAVALVAMTDESSVIDRQGAVEFLSSMQDECGGLKAHKDAPMADLLSTFTGLVALSSLEALDAVDLTAVARFVKELAFPEGGFHGWLGDHDRDVEYTYYGLATCSLLRIYASARTMLSKEHFQEIN